MTDSEFTARLDRIIENDGDASHEEVLVAQLVLIAELLHEQNKKLDGIAETLLRMRVY